MNIRQVLSFALLLLILLSFGCTGSATRTGTETGPNRFGCEGDVPSPYPPYCHPRK